MKDVFTQYRLRVWFEFHMDFYTYQSDKSDKGRNP